MQLVRTVKLIRRQKDSIVHCEIDLCAAPGLSGRYLVNLRQGRPGAEWRDTTRTPQPVALADAERLFDQALDAKRAQGFVDPAAAPAAETSPPTAARAAPLLTDADRALVQRLEPGSWRRLDQAHRSRTIWRIGERRLRAAVPVLVDLLERGDAMQDYCIAWTIGRCGDAGASEAMRALHERGATDAVRRVALQAWLLLADADARRAHAQALVGAWPAALRAAWDAGDDGALLAVAAAGSGWTGLALDAWLEQLDQVAQDDAGAARARPLLLQALRRAPLRPPAFRAIRHLYKMAGMRADAALFGLLQRRFETDAHMPEAAVRRGRIYRAFRSEAKGPDSTVAYGWHTRLYLLQRGWRTLRRLGQDDDPDFVPMALGVLAEYDDRDAGGTRGGDRYIHWPLFNHLLRERAGLRPTRSGLTWRDDGKPVPAVRLEAFPAIWDRHPDALLWLMRHGRSDGVHASAARVLADNAAWCAALPLDTLRELLRSPYPASARFAFDIARRRYEPAAPDAAWLLLFVQAALPEAVQYALDWIVRAPAVYAGDVALVVALLCAADDAARRQGWILCQAAPPGAAEAIVQGVLDWLDDCADLDGAAGIVPAIATDLAWALEHPLRAAAARAPHARLLQLLAHRLAAVRRLACQWLLLHDEPASMLPPATLAALLRDPDADVRALAVRLFGALPDHVLALQADLVAGFARAPDRATRHAIDPVVARLGAADPAFRSALLAALLDGVFRAETGEDMHADLIAWITGALGAAPELDDPDLLRRLLAARSKGAQRLGAALLGRFAAAQFDVADWAAFGRNPQAAVRRWAYAAFEAGPARARQHLEATLRLFDSKFDDTHAFAIDFLGRTCTRADWTPLLLLDLCDHPDPAAQRFGRALITMHFEVADVAGLVLELSQHPSANMQLFVSTWLESTCGGDCARLRRLEPYFLAVLSQVRRGRAVKDRVHAFLSAQALLSEDIGAFVAQLFARQVVTHAVGDKATYIDGLRAIQARYPQLPPVLTVQAPTRVRP